MPISWTVSHPARLVVAVIDGAVTPAEIQQAVMAVLTQNAVSYAKLLDMTFAPLTQNTKGIRAIADRLNEFNRGRQVGPLAVVLSTDLAREMIALFDGLIEAERPLKIFADRDSAHAWLAELGYEEEKKPE
jgi:hypothetical protein